MLLNKIKIAFMLVLSFQSYVQGMDTKYSQVPTIELPTDHINATVTEPIPVTQSSIIQPASHAIHAQPRTYTRLSCKDVLRQTALSCLLDCNNCLHYCSTRESRENSGSKHPQVLKCYEAIGVTVLTPCLLTCSGQPLKACIVAGTATAVYGVSVFAQST